MGVEDDGDSHKASKLSQFMQSEFARGRRLTRDSLNLWEDVRVWFGEKEECERLGIPFTFEPLKPLEHYEAYYKRKLSWNEGEADELMEKSDPPAVAAFDALVDEFNLHLDEVVQKGLSEVTKYYRRAVEIVDSKK